MNDIQKSNPQDEEINLLDYWRVIVKRKRLIGLIVGAAFVTSIIYSLLLPKIYASTASILPPQQQESSLGASLISQLPGGIGGFAGGFLGGKTPADLWVGILKSRTVRDAIIARFDLKELYHAKTIDNARNVLDGVVAIKKSKDEIISISVEDRDPHRAAEMANAFVEELDRLNKRLVMTAGGRMRTFVERRLADGKIELAKAEEAVRDFQENNKAVKLDDQSKAIIEAIGTIKGQLMAREVELQTLLSFATPDNPQAGLLKSQVEELQVKMAELESGEKGKAASFNGIFIPTSKIPSIALSYARLFRDAKVQQTLYELLTQQYEVARIQEAKDSPTVQVLDTAKPPETRVKPKRTQIVLLSTITAGFGGIFAAFFVEYLEKVKTQTGQA